jgi:hypothetical protein
MTLQKATLSDSEELAYTFAIVSYRRLSLKFKFSLSAVTQGIYFCACDKPYFIY